MTITKAATMTKKQYTKIGKACKDALDGNLMVGSFAAEMVGESYPFSKAMCDIVFEKFTDEELGRKFVFWCKR